MALRRCHHQLGCLVDRIVRPIPIDDHAINTAAHHVINLTLDLRRVRFTVTNIHVARLAEPENHVGVNLGCRARIEQGMDVNLADISRSSIIVRLCRKTVGCARIVGSLSGESCGGRYIRRTGGAKGGHSHDGDCHCKMCKTHGSSGAELEPRILLRIWDQSEEGTPAYSFPRDWGLLSFWSPAGLSGICVQLRRLEKKPTDNVGSDPVGKFPV